MKIGIASGDWRVVDGESRWGGAGWARLGQFVPYLRAAGHEVTVGTLWRHKDVMAVEDWETKRKVIPDVVWLQRIMHATVDETIRMGQRQGQIVINDLDDWYWGLDSRNEAWLASHPKVNDNENTNNYAKAVGASDYITVSTKYLADRIMNKWSPQCVLLPNTIEVDRFTPVEQTDEPTYGWAGSTAHRSGDLREIRGIWRGISPEFGVIHSGHNPYSKAETFAEGIGVPEDNVTKIDMATHDKYPELLKMQVGLVPLRDTPFNHAKSYIKGLEYAASGIPFIATPLTEYKVLHEMWEHQFDLAKRPKDWIKALNRMKSISYRYERAAYLQEAVRDHDIRIGADRLLDFFDLIK